MAISGVSGASTADYYNTLSTAGVKLRDQSANVQDEITMSVVKDAQDQQKRMADAIVEMMKQTSQIDVYA